MKFIFNEVPVRSHQ